MLDGVTKSKILLDAALTALSCAEKVFFNCHLLGIHLQIHFVEPPTHLFLRSKMLLIYEAISLYLDDELNKILSYVVYLNCFS